MRVVVVGGGKVGAHLVVELRRQDHSVILVERDPDRAAELGEETDSLVVRGDGTDVSLLEEIEADKADYLVAVTGRDEDNLVACQLARSAFGIPRVMARLNDPRNRATFDALDVPAVSITDLMVQVITRELDVRDLARVALLGRGEVSVLEVEIPEGTPERRVRDIELPTASVLVAVRRDGKVIVPGGDNVLRPRDRVLAVTLVRLEDEVRDALVEGSASAPTEASDHPEAPLEIDVPDEA